MCWHLHTEYQIYICINYNGNDRIKIDGIDESDK